MGQPSNTRKKQRKNYILDTNTRNISFIQTALDLSKLGIKNCGFFLKLYDISLVGVDPFSPTLTEEQIMRITTECVRNPWYFLRECVRIPEQGNPAGIPYLINRANLAMTWCFLNGIDSYNVIPRQIGKTQGACAIINWGFLLGTTNSEFSFNNMQYEKAVENLTRLKDQRDLLPSYLQFKVAYNEEGKEVKGIDNVRKISNVSTNNVIVTKPSATSLSKAEMIGRGSTQPVQWYDEFEFIPFNKTIMEAAGPAFVTASNTAKKNKGLYGRLFTSTPGDLDTQCGMDAAKIIEGTMKWSEKFYDMPIDDVKSAIDKNSSNGIVYIEYSYKQLGKDEEWFRQVCKVVNNEPIKIKREIMLMRIHGSSLSPFEPEDLEAISELQGTIKEQITINSLYILNVYQTLDKKKCYFVGVDVSSGGGDDNSAVTIWDPYIKKTVAEFRSPFIGVKDLIKFLYILVRKYIPNCILIVERNANGEAVLDHLRASDVSRNLYFDSSKDVISDDVDDKLDAKGFLEHQAKRRKIYGVYTQKKSREIMFDLLMTHVNEYKDGFVGQYVISDINKLVRKNGKIQAGAGFHDDSIMSYLMCLYVFYYGKNLHRFGFMPGSIPSESERNKGLVDDFDTIMNAMSDVDREFFEGIRAESYMDNSLSQTDDSDYLDGNGRGLISVAELKATIGKSGPDGFNPYKTMTPYQRKIFDEMQQAQRESDAFDKMHGVKKNYYNMDSDDDYEIPVGFFSELNS